MIQRTFAALLAVAAPFAAACTAAGAEPGISATDPGTSASSTFAVSTDAEVSGTDSTGDSNTTSSPSGESGGDPKLDVASPDVAGGCAAGDRCGCEAVDLLFVVDSSGSMLQAQQNLGVAFPQFTATIVDALPAATSVHVGVTSIEMGFSNMGATVIKECTSTGDGGQPQSAFYVTPDEFNTGTAGAQGRLYPVNGLSFEAFSTADPPDRIAEVSGWFAEAATLAGVGSNVEMSAATAGWAADPANDASNNGFFRDDGSVLVLFFLQDEPDQTPPDVSGADLFAKLVARKARCGGAQCIVGGGMINEPCLDQTPLGELMAGFGAPPVLAPFPFPGGIPEPGELIALLSDTLAQVIVEACEEIGPAG